MTDLDCVLIPLDGSERAEAALDWASVLGARRIRLLRVCPPAEEGDAASARQYLAEAAERASPAGATIDLHTVAGDPAERIVEAAAGTDLIVMSTQGAGAGGRRLFGSVADRVSRHAPVPTLLLRGGRAPVSTTPLRRVVVPLDGSSAAERALPLGMRLAGILGAPIHLVSVHEPRPHEPSLADVGAYLDREAASLRANDVRATTEIGAGTPEDELLKMVVPGDLLVITTHGRGAARRWQIGHVAEKLLRQAPVPVAMIRADGE